MKNLFFLSLMLAATFSFGQYKYPATKTELVTDTYFGVKVEDPYRWLEDIKNPKVLDWFKAQENFTNSELSKIPGQKKIFQELTDLDKIITVKYSPVTAEGGKYFYRKRLPEESVYKLYYRQGKDGKEILLFDPKNYIAGKVMDFSVSISDDGSKIAFNLSEVGSELGDVKIMDVATGKFLSDVIKHSVGNFADGSNTEIIYGEAKSYDTHDPEVWQNSETKLHVIGNDNSKDILLASSKKYPELKILPSEFPDFYIFKNSPYIFLGKSTVENYKELYYAPASDLKKDHIQWKPFCKKTDEIWNFFVQGNDVYLLTTKGNSKFRLIKTSLSKPDFANAKEIVSGDKDWKISSVTQSKDYLVFFKTKNELIAEPFYYNLKTGETTKISTPLKGNLEAAALSKNSNELLLTNLAWNKPINFYTYDIDKKEFSKGPFNMAINFPNLENIVYEEIEAPSHDGTMVPLSILYDKSKLRKDGSNITFMQGYGAYGMSSSPYFSARYLPLLNRGVVLAFAHIRGGGEKGQDWYLAGKKTTKPNTWKDFNSCAEYLIKNKYTSSDKFGISGASAGGILIGRAITERPDLYKVAIPKVGCLNALRMEFSPNGPVNIPEFGTVKDESDFEALLEMDAYQHIKKGTKYPAQLITTGFNDSRVESYIPAKFAAKMQADNASTNPVFLYVDYKAGHFGGSTVEEQFLQASKEYSFLLWQCGDKDFQLK
ncbi:prolyl oligopeptidase family serine peptidase [Epilithonimonas sp. JDS]|uniref:prolyl oligopeptidase family serine peptidase n=1 Tax=Epilithonimonas sp. JDS TaxID=2902797 RepID=UPI001E5366CE|nr:prolyl oligopeptidase family serine peptidase [Epilithonimonas sp. JDS]MCD9853178.1 prolyl oligopeptidase family serine peptidase [Epilithonimonas sp. JDS]